MGENSHHGYRMASSLCDGCSAHCSTTVREKYHSSYCFLRHITPHTDLALLHAIGHIKVLQYVERRRSVGLSATMAMYWIVTKHCARHVEVHVNRLTSVSS